MRSNTVGVCGASPCIVVATGSAGTAIGSVSMATLPTRGSVGTGTLEVIGAAGMANLPATGSEGTGSPELLGENTMFCRNGDIEAMETTGCTGGNGAMLEAQEAIAVASVMGVCDTMGGAGTGGVAAVATGS
mmetsp:Transcript_35239/g.88807  ORF Transcript_35239/g.88807 Transcript_35239/m.88807 type:complete len:132 (+) Transcript_35239:252-647(+)